MKNFDIIRFVTVKISSLFTKTPSSRSETNGAPILNRQNFSKQIIYTNYLVLFENEPMVPTNEIII